MASSFARRVVDKGALFAACGYEPHPGQLVIHQAGPHDRPDGFRFRVVSCGVRFGKSHCAAWEMVAAALAPNEHEFVGWCVAPLHSLASIVFDNVCAIFTNHLPEHVVKVQQHDGLLIVRNLADVEARIYRKSTERGLVSLTGSSVDAMVIDEASAVPDEIYESSLSTRLVDRLGWTLCISTPRGTSGWWARMLRVGLRGDDPDVWAIRAPSWVNPRLDRAELVKARARMRLTAFAQEYEAQLVAHAGKVFDPEAVARCATGRPRRPEPGAVYVAGLDLAISNDYTVLVVCKRGEGGLAEVVHVERFTRIPWPDQVARVRATLSRFNEASVRVDATGLGNPVLSQLREAEVPAEGVVLSTGRKSEIIRNLSVLLERGRIVLPAREHAPEVHDELDAFEFLDRDGGDGRRMGAPKGGHDDCVVALALAASYFHGGDFECRTHFARGPGYSVGSRAFGGGAPVQPPAASPVGEEATEDDGAQLYCSGDAVPDGNELRGTEVVSMEDLRGGRWKFRGGLGKLFP